ncbi:MAG: acetylornithine deacetylase [Deltaproteobacteria bacterium RIFOXYD12_FULL_57_12]|nr:MAG: acetylornithine deacetylase [Deltaproteobacteria bacterium RIFOXYD12_FULL_57_12]
MNSQIEQVWGAIDPQRLRRILLEMIDIYSPYGKEEDIQIFLEELFVGTGLVVRRQVVEEDRYNLVVTMGSPTPAFFLAGHVDTIHAWDLDSFGPREVGDIVYGLGSADMKGGCAAMAEAFLAIAAALPPAVRPNVGLLLAVGEEETGDGAAAFLAEYRPAWMVIGEPTGLAACFAHYGYLEADFVTRGRCIHSSLPELGHNAIESMLRVLLHLGRSPRFDRRTSEIVYSIRELTSSRAGFVVPDRCEAWIDLHLPPSLAPGQVEQTIRVLADSAALEIQDLDLALSFNFAAPGYDLGSDSTLARLLENVYARLGLALRHDVFRSHSDGNLFYEAGVKPLLLGPGELEVAHTPDEQVPFAQVDTAARIYAALCLEQG